MQIIANHCKSLSFLLILYSYQSLAQGGYVCYTEELGASPAPQAQATLPCDNLDYSEEDYYLLNEFTIYVNFHFVENEIGENFHTNPNGNALFYAPAIVNSLINFSNNYWASPILNELSVNPTKVHDSRIRIVLYSEPGNPADPYGGIFFHPRNATSFDNSIIPNQTVYGEKVLHVTIRDNNDLFNSNDPDADVISGKVVFPPGGSRAIRLNNFYFFHRLGIQRTWDYARNLNHEIGHIYGLPHSFSCYNDCGDMDNTLECGGTDGCTNSNVSNIPCNILTPSPCNTSHSGPLDCCRCTWGQGNNVMGYNGDQRALSVCQWEIMMRRMIQLQWAFASFCIKEEPILYLPEGQSIIWDKLKIFNRDVVVQKGTTLTITCEVRMGEGKRIVVHRGGKLIVDGGKITNSCPDKLWAGIAVHGNVNKQQPDPFGVQQLDDAGIVIIRNNSVIEHASKAITTSAPGWAWPDSENMFGGVVYAEYSEFVDNGRVAEFMKYDFENKSRFIGCNIRETVNWAGNTRGITIWDCDGISFEGNTFADLDGTAIYGIDFGANVSNNNSFTRCDRAIEVLATHPLASWTNIYNNTFIDNNIHILANATSGRAGLRINDNVFEKSAQEIAGVWIEGDSRFSMYNNNFIEEKRGIANWRTGTFANRIENNSFSDGLVGIDIRGNNNFLQFTGNCWYNSAINVNIKNISGTLGEVGPIQSRGVAAADNCFAQANSADILAVSGQTVPFTYFAPSGQVDACYLPNGNLTDGGSNNYFVQYVNNHGTACQNNFTGGDEQGDKDKLLQYQGAMLSSHSMLIANPASISLQLEYADNKAKYEHLQANLLNKWIKEGNFGEADAILALDLSKEGKRNRIGLRMLQKDLAGAGVLLQNYPLENADDERFKALQEINLARMSQGSSFALTEVQELYISGLASNQDARYRDYAAAMAALLTGATYEVFLPWAPSGQALAQQGGITEEQPSGMLWRIYPNPAKGNITLVYPTQTIAAESAVCSVRNLGGQEVLRIALDGSGKQEIRLNDDMEGVFILHIRSGEQLLYQDKLVIVK